MRTTPRLLTALLSAATLATVPAAAEASVTVHQTFDALWSVEVSYKHKSLYTAPASAGKEATYRLSGQFSGLRFEDQYLMDSSSVPIDGLVPGSSSTYLDNPEGTSGSCGGGSGHAKGFAVIGKEGGAFTNYALWFAPLAGIKVTLDCTDSDGDDYEDELSTGTVARAPGGPDGTWARLTPTAAQVDAAQWEMPVDIKATADHCPEWDPESSVSCTLAVTGTVRFFRTSRREREDLAAPDLLGPAPAPAPPAPQEPPKPKSPKATKPKLDRKAGKLRTGVACEYDCEVGIGVFTHRKNGKPYVKPVKRRSVRVKGGGATATGQSLTVPLSRKQLAAVRKGTSFTVVVTTTMAGATTTEQFTVRA